MAATHYYTWTWVWSDCGDEIMSSRQRFPKLNLCQLDGLRHCPAIRQSELNGRTGCPQLKVKEQQVLEFRWVITIFDADDRQLGTFTQDKWYDSLPECMQATRDLHFQVGKDVKYELDYESQTKQG